MKIAQINAVCGTGSTGRTTLELAQGLEERGHEAYVFYSYGEPSYYRAYQIGNDQFRKLHALLSRITGLQGYFSFIPTYKLIRQLKAIKPDIVHLRNLHANYINLRMLLNYLAREDIATVITLHDCWFFTGKCVHYVPADCDKWLEQCGSCPLLHKDNNNPTFFFDTTRKCLNDKRKWFGAIPRLGVVGVSKWVADEARKSLLGSRKPIGIYNWIDMGVFYPRQTEVLKEKLNVCNKFVILMVSSVICEVKGYNVLKALGEHYGDSIKLIIVGSNKDALPLPQNAIHIQRTDNADELAEYYSIADVCVNTTYCETFGKVTAEALCCGTPVIVYNNTASPELVGDGCGYVVDESRGTDAIFEAVDKIRVDGKQRYTDRCFEYAREKFSKERGIDEHLRMYEGLLSLDAKTN